MGTHKKRIPPDKGRGEAGSFLNAPCKKTESKASLAKRIRVARAALHDAIRRAGDKPLSQSAEVLRLSRVLDELIDEVHGRDMDK